MQTHLLSITTLSQNTQKGHHQPLIIYALTLFSAHVPNDFPKLISICIQQQQMFNIKNHSNNLQYTERFHYSLYEYYNDYENAALYKQDPTKIFYNCQHKTISTIVRHQLNRPSPLYDVRYLKSPNYPEQLQEQHFHKFNNSESASNIEQEQEMEKLTMEKFLDAFINTFEQANYTDYPNGALEQNKNKYRILYYPDEAMIRALSSSVSVQNKFNKQFGSPKLIYFLQEIISGDIERIMKLNQEDLISIQDMEFYRLRLVYQSFSEVVIKKVAKNVLEGTQQFVKLNMFVSLIVDRLQEMIDGSPENSSYLILYIPNLDYFRYFLNPLILSTYIYLHSQQTQSKSQEEAQYKKQIPKVAIINLTGKESPLNISIIQKSSLQNVLYITIYDESLIENSGENPEISEFYSKLIRRLICETNEKSKKQKKSGKNSDYYIPKILAFPIGAQYCDAEDGHRFMGTSEEILFLFEEVIYQELRAFNPNAILISHGNGTLSEKHFNSITQQLTIISDHRLILYPDFLHLFQHSIVPHSQLSSVQLNQSIFQMQELSLNEIIEKYGVDEESIHQLIAFLKKYHYLDFEAINVNELFNNFGMFLKISSGAYAIAPHKKELHSLLMKYKMGYNYAYLEKVASIPEFLQCFPKVQSNKKTLTGLNLQLFLTKQKNKLIEQNLHKYQYYLTIINSAVSLILSPANLSSNKILYFSAQRLLSIKFNNNPASLQKYLQEKCHELILQVMGEQKICKIYHFPKNNTSIRMYRLYKENAECKIREYLLLGRYTQVVFTPNDKMVVILNYFDPFLNQFQHLYGFIREGFFEIEVKSFWSCREKECVQYFGYSYCFNKAGDTLYLYWPYLWNPIQQTCCNILDIPYSPYTTHKLLSISLSQNHPFLKQYISENILPPQKTTWSEFQTQNTISSSNHNIYQKTEFECLPRYGSTGWVYDEETIYIFGGFYDHKMDFIEASCSMNSGISILRIKNEESFRVNDIGKDSLRGFRLRPKIRYSVEECENGKELIINGGYGRQFTDFYHIFSYMQYVFNLQTHTLTPSHTNRQIISPEQPLKTFKGGKYDQLLFKNKPTIKENSLSLSQNQQFQAYSQQTTTKYSLTPKYKFIKAYSLQNNPKNSLTFLDTSFTVHRCIFQEKDRSHNSDQAWKKLKNIYSHSFASPQIFILNQYNETTRIEILLQTQSKSPEEYFMKQHCFPNQNSIASIAINMVSKRIYMLYSSLIYTNKAPTLFVADFEEMEKIIERKEIRMSRILGFSDSNIFGYECMEGKGMLSYEGYFENEGEKTGNAPGRDQENIVMRKHRQIYEYYHEFTSFDNNSDRNRTYEIIIAGGKANQNNFRWDYKVIKNSSSAVPLIKIGRVSISDQLDGALDMPNPYIFLDSQQNLYLYSIAINHEDTWELKIQKSNLSLLKTQKTLKISSLMVCTLLSTNKIYQIIPDFQNPVFTEIKKYKKFEYSLLVTQLQAILTSLFMISKEVSNHSIGELNELEKECLEEIESFVRNIYNGNFGMDYGVEIGGEKNIEEESSWQAQIRKYLQGIYFNLKKYMQILQKLTSKNCSNYSSKNNLPGDLILSINLFLKSLIKIRMESIWFKFLTDPFEPSKEPQNLYIFTIHDRRQPMIRYLAVGHLDCLNLIFFRIKFTAYIAKSLIQHYTNNSMANDNYSLDDFDANISNKLNEILYCNEEDSLRLLKFKDENIYMSLDDVEKFQADGQIFQVKEEWFDLYKGYEYWDN